MTNVIEMRVRPRTKHDKKKTVSLDGPKFFSEREIKMLRKHSRDKAETGNLKDVRNWMIIDLLTSSGLREFEACSLQIKHLKIGHGHSEILVENGKGGISGTTIIPASLKSHLKAFLSWKQGRGEAIGDDSYLFVGQRGPWTVRAVQESVKNSLRATGLYETGKAVHSLRHSFATELYRKTKDLRLVQKQLRHKSISSTTIYADVTNSEIEESVKGLWN